MFIFECMFLLPWNAEGFWAWNPEVKVLMCLWFYLPHMGHFEKVCPPLIPSPISQVRRPRLESVYSICQSKSHNGKAELKPCSVGISKTHVPFHFVPLSIISRTNMLWTGWSNIIMNRCRAPVRVWSFPRAVTSAFLASQSGRRHGRAPSRHQAPALVFPAAASEASGSSCLFQE